MKEYKPGHEVELSPSVDGRGVLVRDRKVSAESSDTDCYVARDWDLEKHGDMIKTFVDECIRQGFRYALAQNHPLENRKRGETGEGATYFAFGRNYSRLDGDPAWDIAIDEISRRGGSYVIPLKHIPALERDGMRVGPGPDAQPGCYWIEVGRGHLPRINPQDFKRVLNAINTFENPTTEEPERQVVNPPPQESEETPNSDQKKKDDRKMKICRYVMTNDSGLAPNPYHGWCTLAICTPNHRRLDLKKGDWIVGHSTREDGNRLIYAMRVEEVLTFDQYFNDPRFEKKKPKLSGAPEEQCGDNLYYRENGQWRRLPSWNHNDSKHFIMDVGSDLKGCPVFVSQDFYYFGDKRKPFPDKFKALIQERRGATCKNHEDLYEKFVEWLRGGDDKTNPKWILGSPKFNDPDKSKPMIIGLTAHYDPPPQHTTGSKSDPHESGLELTPLPDAKSARKKQGGCG